MSSSLGLFLRNETHLSLCTLPKLQKLTVLADSESEDVIASFFESFAFPNLRLLDIDVYNWPHDILFGLQERSRFTLTDLSLHNLRMDAPTVIRFFQQNTAVEALHLTQFTDQGIIHALTYRSAHTSVLLPRLSKLGVKVHSSMLAEEGEDLMEMLLSRWDVELRPDGAPTFAQLREVNLQIDGWALHLDVEETIEHLSSVGLVVDHIARM